VLTELDIEPALLYGGAMDERMDFAEGFVRTPDLFPARPSGETWGERQLVLRFVGGPYLLSGLNVEQERLLRRRFGGFLGEPEEGEGAAGLMLFEASPSDFVEIDMRAWVYTLDFDYGPKAVRLAGYRWMGRVDWGASGAAGSLWTSACDDELLGVIENQLRILAAYRLAESGGVLLHSSCVVDDGGAYLFLGPSGAGKTTLARLGVASGRTVLSDDLNAISPQSLCVAPVPFAGELRSTAGNGTPYPLRAICRLAQGRVNQAEPLPPALALATALSCAPFVNRDPYRVEALTAGLERIVEKTPQFHLSFNLDESWPELRRCLDQAFKS
jgi:hypothetical protein